MRRRRHYELLVDGADASVRYAEPDSVADAEPDAADATCPASVSGDYNSDLLSVRVQLPFDGDDVVEVYDGAKYNGIELVVDGHAINDGDSREDVERPP